MQIILSNRLLAQFLCRETNNQEQVDRSLSYTTNTNQLSERLFMNLNMQNILTQVFELKPVVTMSWSIWK